MYTSINYLNCLLAFSFISRPSNIDIFFPKSFDLIIQYLDNETKTAGEKDINIWLSGNNTEGYNTILNNYLVSLKDVYVINYDILYVQIILRNPLPCAEFPSSLTFSNTFWHENIIRVEKIRHFLVSINY